MERQTVDFGIDLGTTNSVIARATSKGAKVIENRHESKTTPSAVAIMAGGQTLVGQDALNKPELNPVTQFKRLMGTTSRLNMSDGSDMSPEQLSAEVLKELKAAVQLRYDMQIGYVVITVPAMFQQPQCEATHRAAELAGLKAVALLQEPIAAATAYLNEDPTEGNYLVYDLGGGTFDVSIVRLLGNEMTVLAHGGDNYLGGIDFDRKIADWVILQLGMKFPPFPQLQQPAQRERLLRECGEAKKRISQQETSYVDLSGFDLPVSQVPITQGDVERAMEADTDRTLQFVQERLDAANLTPADIKSILLIGGSTKSPYIRRRLKEKFNIQLNTDQDAMTVVAQGAAIHASTLLKPDRADAKAPRGAQEAVLELFYDPVVQTRECVISGKIVAPQGMSGEMMLSRSAGDWNSGWIPLRNGSFVCDAALGKAEVTDFKVGLRDTNGAVWTTQPAEITIRYGIAAAQPISPYHYGVALGEDRFGLIVKQGSTLPAFDTATFASAKTLPAGSDEAYFIYILEGYSMDVEDNLIVGKLTIRGSDLPRTLREGERVDVRIRMDESRRVKAKVSIPLLDIEYDVDVASQLQILPLQDLRQSITEVRKSVGEVGNTVAPEDQASIVQAVRELEQVEAEFDHLRQNKTGDAHRINSRLSGLKSLTHGVARKYELETAYQETIYAIDAAENAAENASDVLGVAIASDLRRDAERCLLDNDINGLKSAEQRAWDIHWKHYAKTDEYWTGLVDYLRRNREKTTDHQAYHDYLKRAEDCLSRNDREGVRVNAVQALQYLPDSEEKTTRFQKNMLDKS